MRREHPTKSGKSEPRKMWKSHPSLQLSYSMFFRSSEFLLLKKQIFHLWFFIHPKLLKQRREDDLLHLLWNWFFPQLNCVVPACKYTIPWHAVPTIDWCKLGSKPSWTNQSPSLRFWRWDIDNKWQSFFHSGRVGSTNWVFMFLVYAGSNCLFSQRSEVCVMKRKGTGAETMHRQYLNTGLELFLNSSYLFVLPMVWLFNIYSDFFEPIDLQFCQNNFYFYFCHVQNPSRYKQHS